MDIKEHQIELPVINFDSLTEPKKISYKAHGDLFPNSIRAVFRGSSNCGKTNALLSQPIHPNGLKFKNIYV